VGSAEPVEGERQLDADPGTALATQNSSAGPLLGRVVSGEHAKLYLGLVNNALREPLPALDFANPEALELKDHQDMVLRCKQKVALYFWAFHSRFIVEASTYI
jgi:hypothetical protein